MDILLVDDETSVLRAISSALQKNGHRVTEVADGARALERLKTKAFDALVSDVRIPNIDGFELLRWVRTESPATDVLLMTAFGTIDDAVAAMKEKAVDYITKPFDMEELMLAVRRIGERRELTRELEEARAQLSSREASSSLLGRSPCIVRLQHQIEAIAESEAAVLIRGETGTGKELLARTIHDRSHRRSKSMVAVNCGAVPPSLIEAELFGHEQGAFTGAVKRRDGRFKAADGGTLFLDEIGEMPLESQVKLLRVLQEGSFEPIGTNVSVKVDVRIIAATNRDLEADIKAGRFREDLYYRIRVFDLVVPPLRERRGDLPILVEQMIGRLTRDHSKPPRFSASAWAALSEHPFPGNVRELENVIEHAVVLSRGEEIELEHLPAEISRGRNSSSGQSRPITHLELAVEQFEREYIRRALTLTMGERRRAAVLLGVSRKTLWSKLKKYGLADVDFDDDSSEDYANPPQSSTEQRGRG
jgi:DNA-binding NtrC family response regulator